MHYENETGICDYVTYERYCEDIAEKNKQIESLEIKVEDLTVALEEHKQVINELKKLCEEIFNDKGNNKLDKKQKNN